MTPRHVMLSNLDRLHSNGETSSLHHPFTWMVGSALISLSTFVRFSAQGFKCGADWTRVTFRWVSRSSCLLLVMWLPLWCLLITSHFVIMFKTLPLKAQNMPLSFSSVQSWRLLRDWRISWWSTVRLERSDGKSGQNSGPKPQVRNLRH